MKYDFDTIINRQNTMSIKYDFAQRLGKPEGILPLWVADMDFQTAPEILEALEERIQHGIFGYSESDSQEYTERRYRGFHFPCCNGANHRYTCAWM